MFSSLMFLKKQFWKRLYFSVLAIVLAKVPPLGFTSPCNCSLFCSHVKCIWLGDLFFNSLSLDGNDHFISSVLSLNIVGFIRSCHLIGHKSTRFYFGRLFKDLLLKPFRRLKSNVLEYKSLIRVNITFQN